MVDIKELQNLAKKFTVLYVEDEENLRISMAQYLSRLFKSVDTACDGEDGLEQYSQGNFDLVITDIAMPKLDGLKMSKKIKKINNNQEIIIISAFTETDLLMNAIEIGIDGYIIKPADFNQINEIVYKICNRLKIFKENSLYKLHLEDMVELKTQEANMLEEERVENYKKVLYALVGLIEERDTYTGGHSSRVAQYSFLIAQQMGFSKKECENIYEAGMLHDIGKIAIPDSILLKPEKLTKLEYKIIQEHVLIGYKILKKIPAFKNIIEIVKGHHERCDGSGYPDGLKDEAISTPAKIMAVADSIDAMTTKRIYKSKKTLQEAFEDISSLKETLYSKDVVDAALVALRNVHLDEDVNQEPLSSLEKERFSYFYKDQLTQVHNSVYLDLLLVQNVYDKQYSKVNILFVHNFGKYNNKFGWDKGDLMLIKIANELKEKFSDSLVFRIHGDDFAVLSKSSVHLSDIKNDEIEFSNNTIDIEEKSITSFKSLESLI